MPRNPPWSYDENAAVVRAYLELLGKQSQGEQVNKRAFYQHVHDTTIPTREAPAISRKMENISHVMQNLGLPTVRGITASAHTQTGLDDIILEILGENIPAISHSISEDNVPYDISNRETSITTLFSQLNSDLSHAGLASTSELNTRLVSSVIAKPFVILTGVSGSGKSKQAVGISRWLTSSPRARRSSADGHLMVPVGADWTSNEHVLGYADALHPGRYVRTPIIDLVLRASGDASRPYFLILDEMNLSHVERYFSDFLSAMESGEPIQLHSGGSGDPIDGVPAALTLPDNLFVIGTVNVDETTYMFSPKVLDRANTIEFRVDSSQIAAFLEQPRRVDIEALAGRGAGFATEFLSLARSPLPLADADRDTVRNEITLLFDVMAAFGNEFAFRTTHEMVRFIEAQRHLLGDDFSLRAAFDAQVAQKLLPRLNGSRSQLEPVLIALGVICQQPHDFWTGSPANRDTLRDASLASARDLDASVFETQATPAPFYPLSFDKLRRMRERLQRNGFTSFAEG